MITEYKREIQNYSYSIILKHNVTAIKLMQGVRTTLIYIILKHKRINNIHNQISISHSKGFVFFRVFYTLKHAYTTFYPRLRKHFHL